MADTTKIEWADHTFNPWMGCTKISPACDNCYAEKYVTIRYNKAHGTDIQWGAGKPRRRTKTGTWNKPKSWNRTAQRSGTRPFVFCASLADVFDNDVDPSWRADLLKVIDDTPQLVWLLLTKRIGNVSKMISEPLPRNVALGATMANQAEYDRDNPKLREAQQRLKPLFTFGSFEPLLGPIKLDDLAPDWIIVGGESGKGARSMDLDWARSLREQCADLKRVFNFKQVGGSGRGHGGDQLDGQHYFHRPDVSKLYPSNNGDELGKAA